jgi:hypothetical protein
MYSGHVHPHPPPLVSLPPTVLGAYFKGPIHPEWPSFLAVITGYLRQANSWEQRLIFWEVPEHRLASAGLLATHPRQKGRHD